MSRQHPGGALPRAFGSILIAAGAVALAACGGGSSGSSGSGSLTLGITDAAVDSAQEVNVVFTGVTLKPQDGEPITFECDQPTADPAFDCGGNGYREIDLLTLSGDESETLLDGVTLDAGRYDWIRLQVNARGPGSAELPDDQLPPSTITLADGSEHDLLIPSGPQTGLKLVRGFNVPAGGEASFTIDFDLRKAVTLAKVRGSDSYLLRPAFRLVDNGNAGHLVGEISNEFVQRECASGDASGGLAVYLFEGADAATGDLGDADNEPLTTDRAELDDSDGNYDYRIGFLTAGDYTAAVTCEADSDTFSEDPAVDDDEDLAFVATANVTVEADNQPTVQDFE